MGEATVIAVGQLRSFVERFERLEEEKKSIADDQKELMAELKGSGFDAKAFKEIIRLRKKEPDQLAEEEAMTSLYREVLGI